MRWDSIERRPDVRAGDEKEYGDYAAARSRRLCEFAYLLCGDWHAAQDAVQTALTKLYLAWGRLRSQAAVQPYVRKIIVHTIIDERRRARSKREQSWADVPENAGSGDS